MAFIGRIVRGTARTYRTFISSKTLNPPLPNSRNISNPRRLYDLAGFNQHQLNSNVTGLQWTKSTPKSSGLNLIFPAALVSLFGVTGFHIVYADAGEAAVKPSLPPDSPSGFRDLEEIGRNERRRIEELLRSKGLRYGSYPRYTVASKGKKVSIKFQIPPACEVSQLIANLVSHLGLKVDNQSGASDMLLRAWDSAVAWQLTLALPEKPKETEELCILIFHTIVDSQTAEIEFIKEGSLSEKELDAFVSVLQLAGGKVSQSRKSLKRKEMPPADKSVANLESMGVRVYGINEPCLDFSNGEICWENIAGYQQQKREIEDTILLALRSPEVYDDIARGTRHKFESNRPRAVLFEGPPGTGKTSSARVIANQADVPLLYVPLEVVMSKYYGESEGLLAKIFSLANELPDGAIIFLDEVDSFAVARDSEMHEATRRILSVLLRQVNEIEDFEDLEKLLDTGKHIRIDAFLNAMMNAPEKSLQDLYNDDKRVVVIAATNRKQDLDPALISRFDSMIIFGLPDQQNRQEIAAQYAKHLTKSELEELAAVTEEMSGRDIRDVCQQAERSWASKIIRGQASKDGEGLLPPLNEYLESAFKRQKSLSSITGQKIQNSISGTKKHQLV